MLHTTTTALPVQQAQRITILDSLRGIAILGILLMNMPGFALPAVMNEDPSVFNETGANYYTWYSIAWIFTGTQRAIFSMLFGAGILLFIGRKENKTSGLQPADYFFRRQLWLMAFSLIDVFILLWSGDILMDYAIYGMIMFAFRDLPPRKLLIGALISLSFMVLKDNRDLYIKKERQVLGERVVRIDTVKNSLTEIQRERLKAVEEMKEESTAAFKQEEAKKEIAITTANYASVSAHRTSSYLDSIVPYTFLSIWDVLLFMFLGMAFFKWGVLQGEAPIKVYWAFCIVGLGLGLWLSYLYVSNHTGYQFNSYEYVKHVKIDIYQLGRALRAVGMLGLIMLVYRSGWFKWLFALLRPVGQMAFTNYLLQSLICGIIFYGFGFSLFGQLQRYQIYIVVGAIWVFQVLLSHVWLKFFLYGPFEWAWRSLTYWKRQQFKRS